MGSGNSATQAAANANAQSQAQIQNAVTGINAAYNSPARAQQIQTYGGNLQNYYDTQVNQQQAINARDLTFSNARSGLTGGSAAADNNSQLQKDYTTGLVNASQSAQAGQSALANADVNSKNQLIGLAEQGDTTGQLGTQIASAQSAALGAASNYGSANAINNMFAGTAGIVSNEQTAAAARLGMQTPFGGPYGANPSGGSAYQGGTGGLAGKG